MIEYSDRKQIDVHVYSLREASDITKGKGLKIRVRCVFTISANLVVNEFFVRDTLGYNIKLFWKYILHTYANNVCIQKLIIREFFIMETTEKWSI